jgi:luciferase family oxidoreductase group 1
MVPFSVLDLSNIVQGGTVADALHQSRELARQVEGLGYRRFWLAEHHNMPGIASAATAVVIAHVAAGTTTLRIGAGGVMLPNHPPLVIAEQFGTLEALFPGRIDLGIGRAPGTDPLTARALRRSQSDTVESFPDDVVELQGWFRPAQPDQPVRAVPGAGAAVPLWLLGSSLYSARLAAALGLAFAFASHFAPDYLLEALELYRGEYRPSPENPRPHAMACIAVYAAETDDEAARLFSSLQQSFVQLRRGTPGPLPPPVESMEGRWTRLEHAGVAQAFSEAVVGSPDTVRSKLRTFLNRTRVDELMVTAAIYDPVARLRSFELIAQARAQLG